jgi:hypothetical protein
MRRHLNVHGHYSFQVPELGLAPVSWLAETTLVSVLVRDGVEGGLVYDLSPWSPLM